MTENLLEPDILVVDVPSVPVEARVSPDITEAPEPTSATDDRPDADSPRVREAPARRQPAIARLACHALLVTLMLAALTAQAFNPGATTWLSRLWRRPAGDSPVAAANAGGAGHNLMNVLAGPAATPDDTLTRAALPRTIIPDRGRAGVITYTVQEGDTLFGIAYQFDLIPETILWSTPELGGNPHMLSIGQVINIPPVDGVYHTATVTDTLESVAKDFNVEPSAILNEWNRDSITPDGKLIAGKGLVVPGGTSKFVVWVIPPSNPGGRPGTGNGTANVGGCGARPQIIGRGLFMWPTDVHWVSGNPYASWHMAVDLRAVLGANIYASDTGTVIYAGWSTAGYGNLVVIDHGNGWQTWYGHFSEIWVSCGDLVYQGTVIGLAGSTGRSTGPHLHFETRWQGTLPNPLDVLPPP